MRDKRPRDVVHDGVASNAVRARCLTKDAEGAKRTVESRREDLQHRAERYLERDLHLRELFAHADRDLGGHELVRDGRDPLAIDWRSPRQRRLPCESRPQRLSERHGGSEPRRDRRRTGDDLEKRAPDQVQRRFVDVGGASVVHLEPVVAGDGVAIDVDELHRILRQEREPGRFGTREDRSDLEARALGRAHDALSAWIGRADAGERVGAKAPLDAAMRVGIEEVATSRLMVEHDERVAILGPSLTHPLHVSENAVRSFFVWLRRVRIFRKWSASMLMPHSAQHVSSHAPPCRKTVSDIEEQRRSASSWNWP